MLARQHPHAFTMLLMREHIHYFSGFSTAKQMEW
jgi:hypothetical protein